MSEINSIRRLAEAGLSQAMARAPKVEPEAADTKTMKLAGAATVSPFQNELQNLLSDVNRLQLEAGQKVEALAKGSPIDLHEVMLAQEEAGVAFKLVLEMRNKIISAYQEIMRMPV